MRYTQRTLTARPAWYGYSPSKLRAAGVPVSRDFWVRDQKTKVCRRMTDAEWAREFPGGFVGTPEMRNPWYSTCTSNSHGTKERE